MVGITQLSAQICNLRDWLYYSAGEATMENKRVIYSLEALFEKLHQVTSADLLYEPAQRTHF